MSMEDNKQMVARFVEVCQNQHDLAAADALFHPEYVNHYFPGGRSLPAMTRPPRPSSATTGGAFRRSPTPRCRSRSRLPNATWWEPPCPLHETTNGMFSSTRGSRRS